MNHFLRALAGAWLVALTGCSLAFLQTPSETETQAPAYHYEWSEGGTRYSCFDDQNRLVWYQLHSKNPQGQTTRIEKFSPANVSREFSTFEYDDAGRLVLKSFFTGSGTKLYSYGFSYDAGQRKAVEAYFDATDTLVWFDAFLYDADANLVQQSRYDSGAALQWFEAWTWTRVGEVFKTAVHVRHDPDGGVLWAYVNIFEAGQVVDEKTYGPGGVLTARTMHEWDAQGREAKRTYFDASAPAASLRGTDQGQLVSYSTPRALSVSQIPMAPEPPRIPALTLTDGALNLRSSILWSYDDFGQFEIRLGADYYPQTLVRIDSRLPKPGTSEPSTICVEIAYLSVLGQKRIASKTTSFNAQEVMRIGFRYDDRGWLSEIDTSGLSLLIPMKYVIAYKTGTYPVPDRISLFQNESLLQYFVYNYDGQDDQIGPEELGASIDPFGFAGRAQSIAQFDGDGMPVATYQILVNDNGSGNTRINVLNTDGSANGHFLLTHNAQGQTVGFSSFSPTGDLVWDYQYGYSDAGQRISEIRVGGIGLDDLTSSFNFEALFQ